MKKVVAIIIISFVHIMSASFLSAKWELGTLQVQEDAVIDIPGIGKKSVSISARYVDEGDLAVSGSINESVQFGPVELKRAKLTVIGSNQFEISGDTVVTIAEQSFEVDATLKVNKETDEVDFLGKLITPEFRPFADTDVPIIKDIVLKNITVGFDKTKDTKAFILAGETTILNTQVMARLEEVITTEGGKNFVLKAGLQQGWKLSDAISEVKDVPLLNEIEFVDPTFIVSSSEHLDDDLGIRIRRGVGLLARVPKKGPFAVAAQLVKQDELPILYGMLGDEVKDISLAMAFKTSLPFTGNHFKTGAVELAVTGDPSVHLAFDFMVQPPNQADWLTFDARIELDEATVAIEGSMEGFWNDPMGIKGLKIGNVGVLAGVNVETLIPDELGFTGSMEFGTKKGPNAVTVAAKISADKPEEGFYEFKTDSMSFDDVIGLISLLGIDLGGVPDVVPFNLKDVEFLFAPNGGQIGAITFKRGIIGKGSMSLLGKNASMDLEIIPPDFSSMDFGFVAKGTVDAIELGPFKISGKSPEPKPVVDIALKPTDQHVKVNGQMSLFGVTEAGDLEISKQGASFDMVGDMPPFGTVTMSGSLTDSIVNPTITYDIKLQNPQAIMEKIEHELVHTINAGEKIFEKGIEAAKKDVQMIEAAIAKLKARIEKFKNDLKSKMNAAQATVNHLDGEIASAQQAINNEYYRFQRLSTFAKVVQAVPHGIAAGALEARKDFFVAAKAAANVAFEAAKKLLDGIASIAEYGVLTPLEQVAPAARAVLTAAETAAAEAAKDINKAMDFALKAIGSPFKLKNIEMAGKIEKRIPSVLFSLAIKIFKGKPIDIEVPIDIEHITNLPKVIESAVTGLYKNIKENPKKQQQPFVKVSSGYALDVHPKASNQAKIEHHEHKMGGIGSPEELKWERHMVANMQKMKAKVLARHDVVERELANAAHMHLTVAHKNEMLQEMRQLEQQAATLERKIWDYHDLEKRRKTDPGNPQIIYDMLELGFLDPAHVVHSIVDPNLDPEFRHSLGEFTREQKQVLFNALFRESEPQPYWGAVCLQEDFCDIGRYGMDVCKQADGFFFDQERYKKASGGQECLGEHVVGFDWRPNIGIIGTNKEPVRRFLGVGW
jgi:hypothetical protein